MKNNNLDPDASKRYKFYERKKLLVLLSVSGTLALSLGIFNSKQVFAIEPEVSGSSGATRDENSEADVGYLVIKFVDDDLNKTPETEHHLQTLTMFSIQPIGENISIPITAPNNYELVGPKDRTVNIELNKQTTLTVPVRHKMTYNAPSHFSSLRATFTDVPKKIQDEVLQGSRLIYWGSVVDEATKIKKYAAYNDLAGTTRLYEIPKINFPYDNRYTYMVTGGRLEVSGDNATLISDFTLGNDGLLDSPPDSRIWMNLKMSLIYIPPVIPDIPDIIPPIDILPPDLPDDPIEILPDLDIDSENESSFDSIITISKEPFNKPGQLLENYFAGQFRSRNTQPSISKKAKTSKIARSNPNMNADQNSLMGLAINEDTKNLIKLSQFDQDVAFLTKSNPGYIPIDGSDEQSQLGQFFAALSGVTNFGLRN